MDLIRSSIKVLFHDFSLDAVGRLLKEGLLDGVGNHPEICDADFLDRFGEGLKWREDKFTSSEIEILLDWLKDELLTDKKAGLTESDYGSLSLYERVFASLPVIGKRLLDTTAKIPRVRFRHLLRWRDLTLLTGEDLITVATAARMDLDTGFDRHRFCWPNILRHDNVMINHILSDTLSDTHAHLWASTDVFEFNWLVAMNHPDIISAMTKERRGKTGLSGKSRGDMQGFLGKGERQYYDRIARYSDVNLSLGSWIEIAALLRLRLFLYLKEDGGMELNDVVRIDWPEGWGLDTDKFVDEFNVLVKSVEGNALRLSGNDGRYFDYAIIKEVTGYEGFEDIGSPYIVLSGERKLFYRFFQRYYNCGEMACKRLAPVVYLYWLIKIKVRREFVQTNSLRGFRNFQNYNKVKSKFIEILRNKDKDLADSITRASLKFAIQSSILGSSFNNNFEVRVSRGDLGKVRACDYTESIFGGVKLGIEEGKNLTAVVMFIKSGQKEFKDGELRDKEFRDKLDKEVDDIKEVRQECREKLPIVGFDVAGNELAVSPDVFAPLFGKLRELGFSRFTYHVGEEFYDIVHGLRSIDEAVRFLDLGTGCRIGHGLALGVDAKRYYEERHNHAIMPLQVALDNIVWVKFTAMQGNIDLSPKTELFIEEQFARLAEQLGYDECTENLRMFHYWEAMKNRGKDPRKFKPAGSKEPDKSGRQWEQVGNQWERVLEHYWRSRKAYEEGRRTCSLELPEYFWRDVERLQEYVLREIEHQGITIETNPSSNLRIGPFLKYSELPLFRFNPPGGGSGRSVAVTVNTDDKGVFATSLENEYSLVAIALRKQRDADGLRRWSDREIEDYLRQLARYGEITRFKDDG